MVITGWPQNVHEVPKCIKQYWSFRDFISCEDGILMKGDRIMVPSCLRDEILSKLHMSHQGIEKTRLRARTCVYWRGIDNDIEQLIGNCSTCLEFTQKEQKQSMIPHDMPSAPWQNVGSDLFVFGGHTYLVVADYYSKMPFVRRLYSETSKAVIVKLKTIFGEHGIPEQMFSDGGPCYASCEFRKFSESWGFRHIMSSPHYPQSNGFIERVVQTVKATMKKAKHAGTDPELALLCVRATPADAKIGSPTELLYNRRVRTNLPLRVRGDEGTMTLLRKQQEVQKYYYDRSARDRPD